LILPDSRSIPHFSTPASHAAVVVSFLALTHLVPALNPEKDLRHSIIQLHPKLKPTPFTAATNLLAPRTNVETPKQKP
jgi:hypothetical protein